MGRPTSGLVTVNMTFSSDVKGRDRRHEAAVNLCRAIYADRSSLCWHFMNFRDCLWLELPLKPSDLATS